MNGLALLMVALTTAWIFLGAGAILLATRRPRTRASSSGDRAKVPRAVTVLKPLCGADPSLHENLSSFFVQDHPLFEIVFGVEDENDPALKVVRRLIEEHPTVEVRVALHDKNDRRRGHNPKVRNLRTMLRHAKHDLVLVSDSNVRAPKEYLRGMVDEMERDSQVGLVTSIFSGTGGGSWGGDLECVELSGFCASGASLATVAGDAAVVGKSMLFSKSELAALGGLARVADVLAEDFVLGKMFQRAGRKVVIASAVIENVVGAMSMRAFVDRRLRWSILRFRLRPLAFILEPGTSPLAMMPFAWIVMGRWSVAWLFSLLIVRDVMGWVRLRGFSEVHKPILLSLLRETFAMAVWLLTPLRRHVRWRGQKFYVMSGTRLVDR